MKAFISYAHRDEKLLGRLHVHLAMLRREGGISDWYDREILAGGTIEKEVEAQLQSSELFLALASPDFLNSHYCYEEEMHRAIKRHEAGEMLVVPVILEPCDWKSSPLVQFKALPKDGRAITEWTSENAAFLDVVTELRRLVSNTQSPGNDAGPPIVQDSRQSTPRSKYRTKKSFDKIDRDDFRQQTFHVIRQYFADSITEIDQVEGLRGRFQDLSPMSFTCTVLNQMLKSRGTGEGHITVRTGSAGSLLGDITYSFSAIAPENTANGSVRIDSDDYELYLSVDMFSQPGGQRKWYPKEIAQRLWEEFLMQAGISYRQ